MTRDDALMALGEELRVSDELRVRAYYRHKCEAAGREFSVNRSIKQNLLFIRALNNRIWFKFSSHLFLNWQQQDSGFAN